MIQQSFKTCFLVISAFISNVQIANAQQFEQPYKNNIAKEYIASVEELEFIDQVMRSMPRKYTRNIKSKKEHGERLSNGIKNKEVTYELSPIMVTQVADTIRTGAILVSRLGATSTMYIKLQKKPEETEAQFDDRSQKYYQAMLGLLTYNPETDELIKMVDGRLQVTDTKYFYTYSKNGLSNWKFMRDYPGREKALARAIPLTLQEQLKSEFK